MIGDRNVDRKLLAQLQYLVVAVQKLSDTFQVEQHPSLPMDGVDAMFKAFCGGSSIIHGVRMSIP